MSHPLLSSFDPFATHPFTAGGTPPEGSPLQPPTLLPSSEVRSPSQSPASSPLEVPPVPVHAPKPIFKLAAQGVFEQYDRGRVTPDLVVRKDINSWSIQPSFR